MSPDSSSAHPIQAGSVNTGSIHKQVLVGLVHTATATTFFVGLAGCITSSPEKYGVTPLSRQLEWEPCPDGLLDDGEDNNGQIAKVGGRDGYWFTFVDTYGSKVEPTGPFKMTEGGANASKYAAHMRGHLADKGMGVYSGLGFALTNPKMPYDASQATGVSFWAKGPGVVRFKAPDINTAPEGDRCTDCYNDFGVDIYLSNEWDRYTVPFAKLEQSPGWGDRAPRVAEAALYAVQWQFSSAGAEFDIWIDDVYLACTDESKGEASTVE